MVSIPSWVIWSVVSGVFFGGFSIGVFSSQFVSKKCCENHREHFEQKIADISKHFAQKIDEIFDKIEEVRVQMAKMS